ncbi:MAG: hypothetical protein U0X92_14625 [Anaerolineales bacterium]
MTWGDALRPHYATAQRMLGVVRNPKLWKADEVLKQIADERGMGHTFRATDVGSFFGEAGVAVPDPFFGSDGPARAGCMRRLHGGMSSQRQTRSRRMTHILQKNGAEVRAEVEVVDVKEVNSDQSKGVGSDQLSGVRYEVMYQVLPKLFKQTKKVYAKM